MRFFSFETSLSVEEIQDLAMRYIEVEPHSPWNPFEGYTSPRKGAHLYGNGHKFQGYYEDGERNRHGDLQSLKVWITFKLKQTKSGKTKIVGHTYFSPPLAILLLLLAGEIIFLKEPAGLIILSVIFAVFLLASLRSENALIKDIENLFYRQ